MQQTKTIKIFLGSSITELHYERLYLADYLMNSVRPIFMQDGIEVEVYKCEDIRSGNTGRLPQNEIDQLIKECDVSVFMFKNKATDWTVHEFDMARKLQKRKLHEVFVYCFDVPEADKGQELKDFQNRLIIEGIYWHDCKDINDLELQFILGLLKYERKLFGKQSAINIDQESITEKDGDARFEMYQHNEQERSRLREKIHQSIDDLLQQTETVMENEDDTIAVKIIKVIELYKKADRWAEATDYDKEKYSGLLSNYASFLDDYGLYKDAESVLLRQIPLAEELYGTESEKAATSYNNIGLVYKEQGNYGKALEYHQKALAILEKDLGTEHSDTAQTYNNIGSVYMDQGDYDKALEYYQKALAILEKVLGTEHPYTATSYSNIGMVYDDQGNYGKALEYHQKALAIREKNLGTEHPDTATSYNNIGSVYMAQGDYGKALKYYQKALAIVEKVLGTEHPDIANSYNNIGAVFREQGDYGKALEYYVKALAIREKVLGREHPYTAISYNSLGEVYYEQGDYGKALEYYQKALTIVETVLGTEHPYTATSYNNIGGVYDAQGDYDKALEYLQKALVIREKVLGTEHPSTATSYNYIGRVYTERGDNGKALEYYQKALEIVEKVLGTEHPDTATTYNNIGIVYYDQGDYVKALEYLQMALEIREKVLGTEHPDTALANYSIGLVYDTLDDHSHALEYYNKAYQTQKDKLGHENIVTKNTREKIKNAEIVEKIKVTLLNSYQHIGTNVLRNSTNALRSCFDCAECSLWYFNHNSTRNDHNNNTISVSLIYRSVDEKVKYTFEKDEDFVYQVKSIIYDNIKRDFCSGIYFFKLNQESPELANYISQEFVRKEGLKDFIIIPIPDGHNENKIIAFFEISFRNLYSDDIWENLTSFIQPFFSTAFKRFEIIEKQQLMEALIEKHGELKDKNVGELFESIVYDVLNKACPFQGASLFIWDSYQNRYDLIATTGNILYNQNGIYYQKGEGITGSIGKYANPFITDNYKLEENHKGTFYEVPQKNVKSGMFIPICNPSNETDVVGILRLVNKKNLFNPVVVDYFNDADVEIMQLAANYLALIIDHYQKETDHTIFIDKLTHEIITPANAIFKTAYRLYSHKDDINFINKYLSPYLKNIIDFAELQKWQASTNLYLSRNRRKQPFDVRYSIKPTLLYGVIEKSINIALPIARKYNVPTENISIDSKSDPQLTIKIDENAFIMVFYNLFTNAIKYHDPSIQEQFYIDVSYTMNADSLIIDIADNGIGIDEKDKNVIFENGYRSESAIRQNASGYGIGLTVIKQIVEDFDGTISLASLKKPTVFRITIPNNKIQ